ncbi:MAG: TetR/AcrR family transcriptional regulator [Myxococcota bacterium]
MTGGPPDTTHRSDSVGFILEAAAELFTAGGFERTSLKAVADRAGVAKGLIAHHFQSKQGLLEAVLMEFYRRQSEALFAAFDPSLGLHARITAIVDAYFDFMCRSHLFPRLIQHMAGRDERVREISQQQLRRLHTWVEKEVLPELSDQGAASARHFTLTFAGSILTYFSSAPALDPMWPDEQGLLGERALAERRAHLHLIIDAFWSHLELPA